MDSITETVLRRSESTCTLPGVSEADVIKGLREGDSDIIARLFSHYKAKFYQSAFVHVWTPEAAEDCCQEAFLAILEAGPKLPTDKPILVFAWMRKILNNKCMDYLRNLCREKQRLKISNEASPDTLPDSEENEEELDKLVRKEIVDRLRHALHQLAPDARELLILDAQQDMTYQKLAEHFSLSLASIRSRLHRARAELRLLLSRYLDQ